MSQPLPQKSDPEIKFHRCAAYGCNTEVPKLQLMCRKDWRIVPVRLQQEIQRAINERDIAAWSKAARAAVRIVKAHKEAKKNVSTT